MNHVWLSGRYDGAMSAPVQPRLTPEQYLELERQTEFRNEYYDGKIFAMSGGTPNHAWVTANLLGELHNALKKKPCKFASNDLRIRVSPNGLYTYGDIAVVCGEPEYADGERDTLVNPMLIIEVLSQSTEAYDRGFNAVQYRKLASLHEYALVSQTEAHLEIFRRQQGGDWLLAECAGMDGTCRFGSVDCEIALADIYDKITFASDESLSMRPHS